MTGAAERLQIGDFESEFGMRADGLYMIDFEPTACATGNTFEVVSAERRDAKRRPAARARDMRGMSLPASHDFASSVTGTSLEQPLGVRALKEIPMDDDEAEKLRRIRAAVAPYGYLIRKNQSPLSTILGQDFQLVDKESRAVIEKGRLERIERIAFDLCQKKTG